MRCAFILCLLLFTGCAGLLDRLIHDVNRDPACRVRGFNLRRQRSDAGFQPVNPGKTGGSLTVRSLNFVNEVLQLVENVGFG